MPDERLLAPIRRFWSPAQVTTAYEAIFTAYHARLEKVTVIVSKGTDGDSASAEVVIKSADYLVWMEALEFRLQEIEAAAEGTISHLQNTAHTNFGNRYAST